MTHGKKSWTTAQRNLAVYLVNQGKTYLECKIKQESLSTQFQT